MDSRELLSALIQLSKVDNHFDQFEFAYLLKVGQAMKLDNDVVEDMIKEGRSISLQIPEKEEDRMTILYYMLFLMKVDTIVTNEEKELLHHYGFKLGFSTEMIKEFVIVMEEHKFKKLDTNKLLDIIKKYNN